MATSTKSKLTPKQEKFCLNYLKMGNATQAAIAAGYSKRTANRIASQNLSKLDIVTRLKELNGKLELNTIMDIQERKERLTEIARARLTDFMELGADGSWVNIGPETKGSAAIQEIHSRTEYDKDGNAPTIYTSVKLLDPMKAIEILNKMEKLYSDGLQVNIDNRKIVVVYDDIPEYHSQIAPPASNPAEVH